MAGNVPKTPNQNTGKVEKVRIVNRAQHEISMKLIQAVKRLPILYNSKRIEYRDTELKKTYWKQVQKETGMASVDECQKLWKTLRDRFIRETRSVENIAKRTGAPENPSAVRWPYYEALCFYRNCGRSPRTYMSASRRSSGAATVPLNSSGEENTSSSINSLSSTDEHFHSNHQAFIEAVFRQAQTRLETPSPNSSQDSIALGLHKGPASPSLTGFRTASQNVGRTVSPSVLIQATNSLGIASCGNSVQSVYEDSNRTPDVKSIDVFATPSVRERSVSVNRSFPYDQALNLSTHNVEKPIKGPVTNEPPQKKQKVSDEDELFALSLVPSLKRLNARAKSFVKIKILQQLALAEFGGNDPAAAE